MNEPEPKHQQSPTNPWWAYAIFFGFIAFFIGAMFVEDLRKYLILGVTVCGGLGSMLFLKAAQGVSDSLLGRADTIRSN